jgi:hypothetical protein
MAQGTRLSRLFEARPESASRAPARLHPELATALARARQEQRAARLLSSRGHHAEGLRLTLRALDSAFQAAQLLSARNEPRAAIRALSFRNEERALDTLRRARTLDVPALDSQVHGEMRLLVREARTVTHDMIGSIERLSERHERSFARQLTRWLRRGTPRLPAPPQH